MSFYNTFNFLHLKNLNIRPFLLKTENVLTLLNVVVEKIKYHSRSSTFSKTTLSIQNVENQLFLQNNSPMSLYNKFNVLTHKKPLHVSRTGQVVVEVNNEKKLGKSTASHQRG